MITKKDYLFVTHLENGKPAECYICGVSSFDHEHKKGTKPKDFIRIKEALIAQKNGKITIDERMTRLEEMLEEIKKTIVF